MIEFQHSDLGCLFNDFRRKTLSVRCITTHVFHAFKLFPPTNREQHSSTVLFRKVFSKYFIDSKQKLGIKRLVEPPNSKRETAGMFSMLSTFFLPQIRNSIQALCTVHSQLNKSTKNSEVNVRDREP